MGGRLKSLRQVLVSFLPGRQETLNRGQVRPRKNRFAGNAPFAARPAQAKFVEGRGCPITHPTIEDGCGVIALFLDVQNLLLCRQRLFTGVATGLELRKRFLVRLSTTLQRPSSAGNPNLGLGSSGCRNRLDSGHSSLRTIDRLGGCKAKGPHQPPIQ